MLVAGSGSNSFAASNKKSTKKTSAKKVTSSKSSNSKNSKKNQTSNKSASKSTTTNRFGGSGKTVGDMFKSADRGAGLSLQKNDTSIPSFSNNLFDRSQKESSRVNLQSVKPPKSSTFYQDPNDDKARLEQITDQQIQELYKLTQKFKNSPNRGELWLRLAELYVEKASFIDFRAQTVYDQRLQAFQDGKTKVKPKLDLREAHDYNRKAIQLYEWFVRDFPKDPKMDQALYFLGYNYYELGNTKSGTVYYTRLTKEHPRSQYVPESNFALAEYYFENEKWTQALGYYQQVVKNKRHRLYNFSLYKIAWCYFRSGDSRKALITMESLIREGRTNSGISTTDKKVISKVKLESEGLRDIVLFYSEVGDAKASPNYFKSLTGKDANNYLEKLAYYYADRGNREGAKYVFEYLISENPQQSKAFDYKYQIVKAYSNANKTREFRQELYSWVKDYGTGSGWYQANKGNKELIDNSEKLREQTLRSWILQQHQTAQNSRAPFSQGLAFEGYRLYLAEFPQANSVADMHFYYGELLYDMGKFEEAGAQYRWVVDHGEGSKFYKKSSENIVLALERNIPKDEEIANKVGKTTEAVPLDPKVEKFIQAGIWYSNKFPQEQKTPEIRFRIGRLYYMHNQFDQAIPYFKEILQKYPNSKFAEYSANLLLDIFNLKKDYAGLEKTGNELLSIPSIANSPAGADIRQVLERANFKKAQDMEVGKDYAKAAANYESFASQNPKSGLAGTAYFNAAINYERAGMTSKALEAHSLVLKSKDAKVEKLKPKSRRLIAKLYQDSGQIEEAAKAFRASADESGNDPLTANLYFNAAVLDEVLGRNTAAIQNYDLYYQKNKKSDRSEALYSIATLYRKSNKLSAAIDKYKDYVNVGGGTHDKIVESAFWIYQLSQKIRRPGDADEWRRKTLGLQARYAPQKKGVGASYAAQIKLEDAEATFKEYKRIRLNNIKKLKVLSDLKISQLTKLNSQLAEVIKYDAPNEIVASLKMLGEANEIMAESLMQAPLPPELQKPEEIAQYKAGVQKISDPFLAKAKDSYKAAIERAKEFETYSAEYHEARSALLKIDSLATYDGGQQAVTVRQPNWMGL